LRKSPIDKKSDYWYWAALELEYGIEKSKVDSIRSKLFGPLRESYQERDRLRLLVQFRGGSTRALACRFQRLAENGLLL